MMKLSKIRDNGMIMISKMRDKINPRNKRLNLEEAKGQKIKKSFGPDFVSFMVENEPTSYREAVTSSEGKQWREAIKQWHQKFDNTMLESGFKINECDKCVYVKDTSSGYVILCLYVDDMLIVGSNDKMIRSTKDMLKSKFDMKDMGLADVILGIKIIRTQNGLVLSLAQYVGQILNTHYARDRQARTPFGTQSTSGYVSTLEGAAISWKSSKQTVIAKSTMESEFITLDKCGEEAEWLRQFVEDIPMWPKLDNIADLFTKGLSRELVSKSSKGIGLKPLSYPTKVEPRGTTGIVTVVGWYGPSKMHFLKASPFGLVSMYLKKRDHHYAYRPVASIGGGLSRYAVMMKAAEKRVVAVVMFTSGGVESGTVVTGCC
ncbi:retrotransposon protein, putative, ty1-copia subclass [Tanacetum coccineum]